MDEQKAAPTTDNNDVEKNKTMGILAYILFFLPLLTARDSKFAMFHANQAFILFLISVVSSVLGGVVPILGPLVSTLVGLGVFVLWVMGILNAVNGVMKPLPLVGNYTLLK